MGWISCCVRNGREPFRARASADIEEAPRLSAENRREAYVPESWCPPVGSPRRYILRKGAKGGVRGTARGKTRFPAWVRRSSALAPPEQCQPAGWRAEAGTSPARACRRPARGGLGDQQQSRRRLLTALGWTRVPSFGRSSGGSDGRARGRVFAAQTRNSVTASLATRCRMTCSCAWRRPIALQKKCSLSPTFLCWKLRTARPFF